MLSSSSVPDKPSLSRASRRMLLAGAGASILLVAAGCSASATAASSPSQRAGSGGGRPGGAPVTLPAGIVSATSFTKTVDGTLMSVGMAIEYETAISTSTLTSATYTSTSRTVTKVYANTSAALAPTGADGTFVIVEWTPVAATSGGGSRPSGAPSGMPSGNASRMPGGAPSGAMPSGGGSRPPGGRGGVSVVQAVAVTATDGTSYAASTTAIISTTSRTLS